MSVPQDDVRLYESEEILRNVSRLQKERSILARDRADQLVGLLADYGYSSLRYYGDDGVADLSSG